MRTSNQERGGSLVESALTLLALFTLLFAIAEFSRAYHMYQVLVNAAREGSRFAVAPDPATAVLPSTTAIQERVQLFLTSGGIRNPTVTVDAAKEMQVNGINTRFTEIEVAAPFDPFFFPFDTVTISARAEMRNETN
jgi:Flp pilus assembly protein TadG